MPRALPRLLKLATGLLAILLLSGCASKIKTYDSTYTARMPKDGVNALASMTVETPTFRGALPEPRAKKRAKPYFIEFRARNAHTYGHAFVVFGELDRTGRVPTDKDGVLIPGEVEISGLHPASRSTIPWTVGHVVPVPAETGPSDGDFEDKYLLASYRIDLTEAQFRRVVAIINRHKRQGTFWYGPVYSCVHYITAIARDLGLKVPKKLMFPKPTIEALKALNGKARLAI